MQVQHGHFFRNPLVGGTGPRWTSSPGQTSHPPRPARWCRRPKRSRTLALPALTRDRREIATARPASACVLSSRESLPPRIICRAALLVFSRAVDPTAKRRRRHRPFPSLLDAETRKRHRRSFRSPGAWVNRSECPTVRVVPPRTPQTVCTRYYDSQTS